jgi:hypothetical protein
VTVTASCIYTVASVAGSLNPNHRASIMPNRRRV